MRKMNKGLRIGLFVPIFVRAPACIRALKKIHTNDPIVDCCG